MAQLTFDVPEIGSTNWGPVLNDILDEIKSAFNDLESSAAKTESVNTALLAKANTGMDNVTAAGKQSVVGWGKPNYAAGVACGVGYTETAPSNGWIMFRTSTVAGYPQIYVNEILFAQGSSGNYGTCFDTIQEIIPVSKGDTFSLSAQGSAYGIFYPCKV